MVQSTSHVCLEAHKHKGTTFQGTQISTVSWCSRKQTFVALSTAEAEYIALCVAVCEAVRLRKLLAELLGHEMDSTVIHCNNQSCVNLFENPMFNDKSKHIGIWCRGKQYMCSTFLHTSKLHMSSPNRLPGRSSSTSVRDLAWWRMSP
jgi:hypothetical protein